MKKNTNHSQIGQSLVEVALVLPFLIMLIAGVVEFSNFVVTKSRVSIATRSATRFAVNGGENEGMWVVALNAVTQTLPLYNDRWDMWSIRGQMDQYGTNFVQFDVVHIYGVGNTGKYTSTVQKFANDVIQDEVRSLIQKDQFGNANPGLVADMEFVGMLSIFDTEFVLGLDTLSELVEDSKSIRQLHIMRRTGLQVEQTDGCQGVFPIGIEEGIRSVLAPNYPTPPDFDYPSSNSPQFNQFVNHVQDIPLDDAHEGFVYKIQGGLTSATFHWLKWNEASANTAGVLATSLSWPGDSHLYGGTGGYNTFGDITDHDMHVGDKVSLNSNAGNWASGTVSNVLDGHIDGKRSLRFVTWLEGNTDGASYLTMNGYAIFRLHGYHQDANPSNSWLLLEFIRWDTSCGQTTEN